MKIAPLKGTNDYLPKEVALRDYLQNTILSVYQSAGYERISTPIIEDIENIDKSDGGDNLNLIFKILKRGEKFDEAFQSGNEKELCDMGLRYDLTLPLSRYYANNRQLLMNPAKCIQIDRVYRAERPQKGRLREFYQCDIDILGSKSNTCEIDLILTTAKALFAVGMKDFSIHINDRSLLSSLLSSLGVPNEMKDSVCITLDKLDKIGVEGIQKELQDKELDPTVIGKIIELMSNETITLDLAASYIEDKTPVENLKFIMEQVSKLNHGSFDLIFDLTLIRGQGYYTGPVFEVRSNEFHGAIGGGGRYDKLIGKFLNEDIPAVGFSIGFERIYSILKDQDYKPAHTKKKIALLYYSDQMTQAYEAAEELRKDSDVSLIEKSGKVGKLINRIQEYGFQAFAEITQDGVVIKEL